MGCPFCGAAEPTNAVELRWKEYRLLRCPRCDLVYSDRRDIPPSLYDKAYEELAAYTQYFDQAKATPSRRMHVAWAWRKFFHLAPEPGRLLDIGCATGPFMASAQDRGWKVVGIDLSPAAVKVAAEVTGAEVHVGTLEQCAFPDASFDAVTAWEVLEHVADPVGFMAGIERILRPGGVVAISTPNWQSRWERATTHPNRRPPFHLTYWSPAPLESLLAKAGFTRVVTHRKPFAWDEEVGSRLKWVYLPVALLRSVLLDQKGNRLFGAGWKAGG